MASPGVSSEVPARSVRLADDREVLIRSATTADLAGIVDCFERVSSPSRYVRFFASQPRMRRVMVGQVVAPGTGRVTVLAQPVEFRATARHVVAVGGWAYAACEDRCDISVTVADTWQNARLGSYVGLVLLQSAVASGHARFSAEVRNSNVRVGELLHELDAVLDSRQGTDPGRFEFELRSLEI